jgi:hypothetical protein
MTTEYLPHLIQLAQVGGELASIQHDLQNASTTLALQDVVKRLFNVVSLHLYHSIHDAVDHMNAQGAAQPQAAAEPVYVPAPVQQAPALSPQASMHSSFGLPGLPTRPPIVSFPGLAPTASNGMPGISPSDVANVVITPQGTQVIPPTGAGAPITLPPNVAVDLVHMGRPELPPAPPGVAQVVVPQGGAVTPELAAALAAR